MRSTTDLSTRRPADADDADARRRPARSSPASVTPGDPDLRADRKDLKADAGRRLEEAVARESALASREP